MKKNICIIKCFTFKYLIIIKNIRTICNHTQNRYTNNILHSDFCINEDFKNIYIILFIDIGFFFYIKVTIRQ